MPSAPGSRGSRVTVTIAGQSFRLRTRPALDWIVGAVSPDMSGVFPGLVRDADIQRFLDLWSELPDMQARCRRVSHAALGRAGRREWHWSANLIQECWGAWTQVNGLLVRDGVHAAEVDLPDWLDAAYSLLSERLRGDDKTAFETRLNALPRSAVDAGVQPRMSSRSELMAFARD